MIIVCIASKPLTASILEKNILIVHPVLESIPGMRDEHFFGAVSMGEVLAPKPPQLGCQWGMTSRNIA